MSQWLAKPMAKEVAALIERVAEQIRDPSVQEFGQVVRVGSAVAYTDSPTGTIEIRGSASIGER